MALEVVKVVDNVVVVEVVLVAVVEVSVKV
jgi:hypothetical protein